MFIVARTDGDPEAVGGEVRRAILAVDPAMPLFGMRTMDQRMAGTIEVARFNTMLLTILGAVGLLLSAMGIYGVVAYFASQRTAEIGIRLALGASRGDLIRMVVGQAAGPVLGGIVIGAGGAVLAARTIATQLVNVQTTDPLTFAAAAGDLLLIRFWPL